MLTDWLKNVGSTAGKLSDFLTKFTDNSISYVKPQTAEASSTPPASQNDAPQGDTYNVDKILSSIRYMESRGQKDPYGFSQPSGSPKLGDALGAYQLTEAKINEQAKKLGYTKPITKQEFLSNPQMQDEFMKKLVQDRFINQFKFDLPTIFAAHRGGFSNLNDMASVVQSRQDYVNQAMDYYNKN